MSKLKITGKELRAIGYPEGPVISVAMNVMQKNYKHHGKEEVMELLQKVLASPIEYMNDAVLALIAEQLIPKPLTDGAEISMNNSGIQFNVFGQEHIEEGAMHQMYTAAKLPVAVAGALMPDAHSGYGLPIGGVLATNNAVIPYGVGVDIGCRMCLSIFDIDPKELTQRESYFAREINEATLFGSGGQFDRAENHAVMENELFFQLPLLKNLHGRAWKQLGSSGSGNHFVEFGVVEIKEKDAETKKSSFSLNVLRHKNVRWAVIAQFFYVGAQVCVGSFFIRFSKFADDIPEKRAAFLWGSIAMVGFMAGRFAGTFIMKYIKPARLLAFYAVICMALLAVASLASGSVAIYALMAVPFFMSIMFPTIFALGINGLGEETKIASSLIVMSIVGGAIFPLIMGQISDATGGNIQLSYIVPLLCFIVILLFAIQQRKSETGETVLAAH